MSSEQVSETNSYFFIDNVGQQQLVKPTAEKWKNFPPTAIPFLMSDTLEKVKNFEVFEDDIFLTGFPRSGTTITAEMMWLIANNFDFEKATRLVTDDRVAGLE